MMNLLRAAKVTAQSPRAAIRALVTARDSARAQAHSFSAETWRFWRELEREIDVKLQDAERRLTQGGFLAAETVSARMGELHRALDDLLRDNSTGHVHAIMTPDVKSCRPDDSLHEAARLLWECDCGALPVTDADGKVVGMITDRDVCMAAYTRGAPLAECTVESAMAHQVHTSAANQSIPGLAELMRTHRVRRVPVTAPDGTLVGIVSVADLSRYLHSLPDEHPGRALLVPTLAAISERSA